MTAPLVSMHRVSVRKPGALILRSIDLDLLPGSATALFGANGTGKSTLLRVAATLQRPSAGTCTVLGATTGTAAVREIRPRIGLVGHTSALYDNLTVRENLELIARIAGVDDESVQRALTDVGMAGAAHRRISQCSNGMKRRTEFARLLVTTPQILLLDEAHVGLDPDAVSLVGHLVSRVTGGGGAALVVAHEESLVEPFVDRAVRLVDGELVA